MNENPYRRESSYAERYRDQRFATGHGPRTDQRERQAVRTLLTAAPSQAGPWLDRLAGLVAGKRLKPVLWLKTLIGKDAALGAAHSVREPVNHS